MRDGRRTSTKNIYTGSRCVVSDVTVAVRTCTCRKPVVGTLVPSVTKPPPIKPPISVTGIETNRTVLALVSISAEPK